MGIITKKIKIEFRLNYETVKEKYYIFIREHKTTTWCFLGIPFLIYESSNKVIK